MTHTVTEEFITGAEVDVLLRADGTGVVDETMTMLEIIVIPYNDPVVKVDDVVMQTLVEDGQIDFGQYYRICLRSRGVNH